MVAFGDLKFQNPVLVSEGRNEGRTLEGGTNGVLGPGDTLTNTRSRAKRGTTSVPPMIGSAGWSPDPESADYIAVVIGT